MQLHHLTGTRKPRRRIGRGGKRGTTSGRGQKGQKSRSGRKLRPAIRDLILRISKKRGFRNKPKSDTAHVIDLTVLSAKLKPLSAGGKSVIVNRDTLKQIKIVPLSFHGHVKILGKGDVDFPMVLQKVKVSKGVKAAIEKAGGKVE